MPGEMVRHGQHRRAPEATGSLFDRGHEFTPSEVECRLQQERVSVTELLIKHLTSHVGGTESGIPALSARPLRRDG